MKNTLDVKDDPNKAEPAGTNPQPAEAQIAELAATPTEQPVPTGQMVEDDTHGPVIIQLRPVLNVTSAMATARQFIDQRGRDVVVDASQVQHLGGQSLQILLSAVRSWTEDGQSFALGDCSDRFLEDLKLFGFEPHHFTAAESIP